VVALGLLVGCSSSIRRQLREPPGALPIEAVVVYPVRITGTQTPDWRTWELNERLVGALVARGGDKLQLFGPAEFQVVRWEDEGAWVASNAVPLLVHSGVNPEKALVLRLNAERRVASQTQEARDAKGRARAGSATEETTWVCTAELLHPSTRLTLAEFSAQVTVDPFAEPTAEDEFDPAAAMTHLLEQLAKEALDVATKYTEPHQAPPSMDVTFAESPAMTASFPDPLVAKLDPLQAELWMQGRAKFLSPWLDDAQVSKLVKLGPGLWVVGAPASAGVQPGDLVVQVDGAAPQRQILARRRLAATPVQVKVRRGGNGPEVDTTVP
jgi:hypothetical protein